MAASEDGEVKVVGSRQLAVLARHVLLLDILRTDLHVLELQRGALLDWELEADRNSELSKAHLSVSE